MGMIHRYGSTQTPGSLRNGYWKSCPKIIADMPNPEVPESSWRDYGEIILCKDREEMCRVNDEYAAEHVQVMAEDLEFWVKNLKSYRIIISG